MLAPDASRARDYRDRRAVAARCAKQPAEQLGAFAERVRWVGIARRSCAPFTGVHFSNELLDAFPVHRVSGPAASGWSAASIGSEDRFVFVDGRFPRRLLTPRSPHLPPLPAGYETEINLAALDWLDSQVAAKLERGFVLAIDYGFSRDEYYRPERTGGTLSAYAAHRREPDPLAASRRDRSHRARRFHQPRRARAKARGLQLAGFTDQHHFMVGLEPAALSRRPPDTPPSSRNSAPSRR